MEKEKIICLLEAMSSEELVGELRQARKKTIDFFHFQQRMLLEVNDNVVRVKVSDVVAEEKTPAVISEP